MELLRLVPLHAPRVVAKLFLQPETAAFNLQDWLFIYCERCESVLRHHKVHEDWLRNEETFYGFLVYTCFNCYQTETVFGLKAQRKGVHDNDGICTKIYQDPPFGNPIPKRLFQLIGEANRGHFLQARRAIARGLGIGAYAYYRRIVENTKFELVSSVRDVAEKLNSSPEQIELLKKAQSERQFSKAIEMLREASAVPAVLLIDGHNPLALLHDALSEGIHTLADEECLNRAKEAEVILCELADLMQVALTDRKVVKDALSSIIKRRKGDKDASA